MQTAAGSGTGQEIKVRDGVHVAPSSVFLGDKAKRPGKMKTECGRTMPRTVTFWSRSRDSAMDPPLQSEASQTQPPSPLTSYRWHTGGGGEKTAGGFRWGRFAAWGRTLSHQEPMVSSQPASRSLFRRVLSAPPKESRPNRLRLSKTLWKRHKNVAPLELKSNPKAPGTFPHPPQTQSRVSLGGGMPGCLSVNQASISPLDTGSCGECESPAGSGWGPQQPSSLFLPKLE